MTNEEMQTEHGRALAERQALTKKMECLRYRLRTYGSAFAKLPDDPFNQELRETIGHAPDLGADAQQLQDALTRIDELNRLLDLS